MEIEGNGYTILNVMLVIIEICLNHLFQYLIFEPHEE